MRKSTDPKFSIFLYSKCNYYNYFFETAPSEDQKKLTEEYQEYQRKLDQQKEEYIKEHPEAVSLYFILHICLVQIYFDNYLLVVARFCFLAFIAMLYLTFCQNMEKACVINVI